MILLMLFFTVIGSWYISTAIKASWLNKNKNGESEDCLDFQKSEELFVTKKKIDLNRLTLFTQLIYAVLTFILLIFTQVIEHKDDIPKWLAYSTISLYLILCFFLVAVGIKTSLMMNQTGIKLKWPIYLLLWGICFTYLGDTILQSLIFYDREF